MSGLSVPIRSKSHRKSPTIFTYGVLGVATLFSLTPILWGLSTSLKPEAWVVRYPPHWLPPVWTFENYVKVLQSNMPRYMFNSIWVGAATVCITLAVSVHAAYAAARFRFTGRNTLLFLILSTAMIPGISVLIPLYLIATQVGLYNTFTIMIVVYSAWQTPTLVWILKSFFETVPQELEEAALIDGCGRVRTFYQLVLPVSQPGIAAAALLAFVYVWNDFLIAFSFVTKEEMRLISVGLYQYITQYGIAWGELMAAVVLALLPIVILFLVMQTRFIQGLTAGAVKG